MVNYDPSARLPSSKELPDSDDVQRLIREYQTFINEYQSLITAIFL